MINLTMLEDTSNTNDVPIGTKFERFPMSLRTHGRSWLSDEQRMFVRNTVSDFIKSARVGQIWKASGGFGSSGDTFEVVTYRNGLGLHWIDSRRTYELNRKSAEEFIFNGAELVGYQDNESSQEDDSFDDIIDTFTELGYHVSDGSDKSYGEFKIEIQDKSDDHIIYSITVYTGLVFDVEVTVWDDGMNVGEYRLPTRGRKPIDYIKTVNDVHKADMVLRNLSPDILHKKWSPCSIKN